MRRADRRSAAGAAGLRASPCERGRAACRRKRLATSVMARPCPSRSGSNAPRRMLSHKPNVAGPSAAHSMRCRHALVHQRPGPALGQSRHVPSSWLPADPSVDPQAAMKDAGAALRRAGEDIADGNAACRSIDRNQRRTRPATRARPPTPERSAASQTARASRSWRQPEWCMPTVRCTTCHECSPGADSGAPWCHEPRRRPSQRAGQRSLAPPQRDPRVCSPAPPSDEGSSRGRAWSSQPAVLCYHPGREPLDQLRGQPSTPSGLARS